VHFGRVTRQQLWEVPTSTILEQLRAGLQRGAASLDDAAAEALPSFPARVLPLPALAAQQPLHQPNLAAAHVREPQQGRQTGTDGNPPAVQL